MCMRIPLHSKQLILCPVCVSMDLEYCGHCNKRLTRKTFKEHHRLYFHEGEWIGEDSLNLASTSSSPLSSVVEPPEELPSLVDEMFEELPDHDLSSSASESDLSLDQMQDLYDSGTDS